MTNSTVFAITAVHNHLSHTKSFIKSLKSQNYSDLKIVIVDDGSTDDTGNWIKMNHKDIKIIRSDGSEWWTGGINLALTDILYYSKSEDYVLILNNDCIVKSDYVTKLVTDISHLPQKSIIGSIEKDLVTNKIVTGELGINWQNGQWLNNIEIGSHPKICTHLTTKGTLFPARIFHELGLFDQHHFPHYGSDFEYTNRARKNGYKLYISRKHEVYCDQKRTGLSEANSQISISSIWSLMWSRKSTINLVDHFWLITLMCPHKYLVQNYFRLILKFVYLASYPLRYIT